MVSQITVTTAAVNRNLTTLARIKQDIPLNGQSDALLSQMIVDASASIAAYVNYRDDGVAFPTLGRETITESWRGAYGQCELVASRAPLVNLATVQEGGVSVARIQAGTDGAITAGQAAFQSALGPAAAGFSPAHVGKTIVIVGAGAGGTNLTTTVASFTDAQNVVLTDAAQATVSGAAYTIDNPAFVYEWESGAGLIWKVQGDARVAWSSDFLRVVYSAGWLLPDDAGRNLPYDIEAACVLLVKRRLQVLQDGAASATGSGAGLKSETIFGIGSWTYESASSASLEWSDGGISSDVATMLQRYRRYVV